MNDELQRRFREHLEARQAGYLDLLRRMVAINSFTLNCDGIEALAEVTAEAFEPLGFQAEKVAAREPAYGPHLVLTRGAREAASAPQIGLVSHLDTVFPPEEEKLHDFAWREEGERIYGPGTVDIKGGTVVAYMVLDALAAVAPEVYESVRWTFLLNSAEERISPDFGELCRDRLVSERTLGVLVLEGGLLEGGKAKVVVARKGMAIFRVTVQGRGSHAGNAHDRGASAVVQMADVIRQIEGWTDYSRALTFNVGTVQGGTVTNRVPHSAVAEVEMRAFDTRVFDEGMVRMLALEEYCSVFSAADSFPCVVRVEVLIRQEPWPHNEATERLFEAFREAAPAVGLEVVPEERGGLSDGNQLWESIPTLDGLGPSGANAHCSESSTDGSKEQEYATRTSFVPKALLSLAGILRLLER